MKNGRWSLLLRAVFNGRRYVVKTGAPWRWMPDDLPPWDAVYQQAQSWLAAGCFGQRADDLPRAKRGFVLLPPRWVVERSFAWVTLPPPRQRL